MFDIRKWLVAWTKKKKKKKYAYLGIEDHRRHKHTSLVQVLNTVNNMLFLIPSLFVVCFKLFYSRKRYTVRMCVCVCVKVFYVWSSGISFVVFFLFLLLLYFILAFDMLIIKIKKPICSHLSLAIFIDLRTHGFRLVFYGISGHCTNSIGIQCHQMEVVVAIVLLIFIFLICLIRIFFLFVRIFLLF